MRAVRNWFLLSAFLSLSGYAGPLLAGVNVPATAEKFFSEAGAERTVEFSAVLRTEYTNLESLMNLSEEQRDQYRRSRIIPVTNYLFGPLTHRSQGSPQRGAAVEPDWAGARLGADGRVELPYRYRGTWILDKKFTSGSVLQVPVAFNTQALQTPNWKNCTDQDPEHQTVSFYWYFWDPSRRGCDHSLGNQYQMVDIEIGTDTMNTQSSMPEYAKLLRSGGRGNNLQMTIAFGYVKDPENPNPAVDPDQGIAEYRRFLGYFHQMVGNRFAESSIRQGEYRGARNPNLEIGRRFTARWNGVDVKVNVVTTAGIDQMMLFAKSFAHDHDGVFVWMGHSRVGSGFDALQFRRILASDRNYYSVTREYQMIYWGGCNSYSYYSLPFFDIKAEASGGTDPNGTKGLDIMVNGLPSYFSLNAANAATIARSILNFRQEPTYQSMIREIEASAARMRIAVLAAVMGDEDNEAP